MHAVSTEAFRAYPWEVGEGHRADLLAWFLDADFDSAADFNRLINLTGRRWRAFATPASAAESDLVPPGTELGSWKVPDAAPRQTIVRVYGDLQRYLSEARAYWQRAKEAPNSEQRQLLAQLALERFRQERADVTALEVERDPDTGAVSWPSKAQNPRPVRRASSLAGELAIALYDELMSAKTAGLCKNCGAPWLSPVRKRRQLCYREECARKWRNDHRKPEDPAVVYERVKRLRARRARGRQS